jgi:type II secretory pathway component PulJ
MRKTPSSAGFSLMEVNMAVFVMAVGILSLVALFPLGLRESIQGKQDLQQSMFADYALNQLVGALSQTNVTWTDWVALDHTAYPAAITIGTESRPKANLPSANGANVQSMLDLPGNWTVSGKPMQNQHYRILFDLKGDVSSRILGIGVRSTDMDLSKYELYTNNVLYYAEVMFQGDPTR